MDWAMFQFSMDQMYDELPDLFSTIDMILEWLVRVTLSQCVPAILAIV